MTSAANTGNAIERLRAAGRKHHADEEWCADMAAVDALYQLLLSIEWHDRNDGSVSMSTADNEALAAAVRRVNGDA